MKKIVSILLCLSFLTCFAGTAVCRTYAGSDDPPAATAAVGTVSGKAGATVKLGVALTDASGIKSLAVSDLVYDDSALELIGGEWTVPNTALDDWNADLGKGVAALKEEANIDGEIFELTFRIKDQAKAGNYPVSLTVAVKNAAGSIIPVENIPGKVTVAAGPVWGDVNGDGDVNMKDVLLLRKIIAGAEKVDEETEARADVDGDGNVNMKDVLMLRKVIAGVET